MYVEPNLAETTEMLQYLERPLIYNNLQVGDTRVAKMFNIVKTWTHRVDPKLTIEPNSAIGNIKEVKIFLNMNKPLNMDWRDNGTHESHISTINGAEYEVQDGRSELHASPTHTARHYLIITAFSPELQELPTGTNWFMTPTEAAILNTTNAPQTVRADVEPSYDILIRRGYNVVSATYNVS